MCKENVSKQYVGVDIFKLICAFFVVGIHWCPLRDYGELANYWYSSIVCRIAVPFFFLAAGFFLRNKTTDKSAMGRYLLRLLQLYLIYTFIYLPTILCELWEEQASLGYVLGKLIVRMFWRGTYLQFWFFPALIFSVLIVTLLDTKVKIPEWVVGIIATILYLLGVFASPNYVDCGIGWIEKLVDVTGLAMRTRNGLFFGFPLVYMGHLIYKHEEQIRKVKVIVLCIICIITMGLYGVEGYLANSNWNCLYGSMWIVAPFVAGSIFIWLIRILFPEQLSNVGTICRNLSTWVFAMHMYVYNEFSFLVIKWEGSYLRQCLILAFVVALWGMMIIALAKSRTFRWLNNLY